MNITVNGQPVSAKRFTRRAGGEYLPSFVFGYYSGPSISSAASIFKTVGESGRSAKIKISEYNDQGLKYICAELM
jgi:hypothetical protein